MVCTPFKNTLVLAKKLTFFGGLSHIRMYPDVGSILQQKRDRSIKKGSACCRLLHMTTSIRNPLNCVQLHADSKTINKTSIIYALERGILRTTEMLNSSMHLTIPFKSTILVNRDSKYKKDGIYVFKYKKSVMVRHIKDLGKELFISCENDKYKSFTVSRETVKDFVFIGRVVGVITNV